MMNKKIHWNSFFIERREERDSTCLIDDNIYRIFFDKVFIPLPREEINGIYRVFSDYLYSLYRLSFSSSLKSTPKPRDPMAISYKPFCVFHNHSLSSSCSRVRDIFPGKK
jgi:hypothetical protein